MLSRIHTEQPHSDVSLRPCRLFRGSDSSAPGIPSPLRRLGIAYIALIHRCIDRSEVIDFEIEFQKACAKLPLLLPVRIASRLPGLIRNPLFSENGAQLRIRIQHKACQTIHILQNRAALRLPSDFKQLPADPPKLRIKLRPQLPDRPSHGHDLIPENVCAVHLPPAVHQIVCLIDQEQILLSPAASVRKKTPQICMRIEQIIVISDDCIREQAHIQRHFKRADLVLLRILRYFLPGKALFLRKKRVDCRVDPVKMSFCPKTALRIAVRLLQNADLFLCCQQNTFQMETLVTHLRNCCFRSGSCHRLRSQIENPICLPLSNRLDGRKKSGNRLPGSCRRLQKQLSPMHNRPVNIRRELPLSLAVGKREFQAVG